MRKNNGISIFVADELHPQGIILLKKHSFKVMEPTGLTNNELLNYIVSRPAGKRLRSALIVRSFRKIDKNFITKIKRDTNICLICTASSGFDNIDIETSFKSGIDVLNVPYGNFISAAEHTFALILASFKNLIAACGDMKRGIFEPSRYLNRELSGKTIGIIGVGRIGSAVAKMAASFRMQILGNDIDRSLVKKYPWIRFVTLERLLKVSDIITIHTPLDRSTRNLINGKNIKFIKKNALIINCARGGIIDEKPLARHLKKGKFYAGIDVFINEPEFNRDFRKASNVILTPHLAGKTAESKIRMSVQLAEGIIGYFAKRKITSHG